MIMIENYRSGLLWKLFMADPDVRTGPAAARLCQPACELEHDPKKLQTFWIRSWDKSKRYGDLAILFQVISF